MAADAVSLARSARASAIAIETMTTAIPTRYTTLTADESAEVLTRKIRAQEPFFFVRYGDGALECLAGKQGMTCDREQYSPQLAQELNHAWKALMRGGRNVFVGDWLSASFDAASEHARYAEEYASLVSEGTPQFLHFEALLLMRESEALLDFYRAVKQDTRRKVFMGPVECAGAAKMLGARHVVTPMHGLLDACVPLSLALREPFDVLLYGAGMAGNIPAVAAWITHPERMFINLGSALDPLFMGRKSRRQQISPERARAMFRELL